MLSSVPFFTHTDTHTYIYITYRTPSSINPSSDGTDRVSHRNNISDCLN